MPKNTLTELELNFIEKILENESNSLMLNYIIREQVYAFKVQEIKDNQVRISAEVMNYDFKKVIKDEKYINLIANISIKEGKILTEFKDKINKILMKIESERLENYVEKFTLSEIGLGYLLAKQKILDNTVSNKQTHTMTVYRFYYLEYDVCKRFTSIFEDYENEFKNIVEIGGKKYISIYDAVYQLSNKLILLNPKDLKKSESGIHTNQYLNILLKGVPGVGKSMTIDNFISKVDIDRRNAIRINVHSGSNNTFLMQGIGVTLDDTGVNIKYSEKNGLILDMILRAIYEPDKKFAIVLEEIQENSLNELIGDLIYLIERNKRTSSEILRQCKIGIKKDLSGIYLEDAFLIIEELIDKKPQTQYTYIPNLVENNKLKAFRKIILPDNIYFLCTTNYREDKKIIEDNLFRRFEVIDILPNEELIDNFVVKEFFKQLNKKILNIYVSIKFLHFNT